MHTANQITFRFCVNEILHVMQGKFDMLNLEPTSILTIKNLLFAFKFLGYIICKINKINFRQYI